MTRIPTLFPPGEKGLATVLTGLRQAWGQQVDGAITEVSQATAAGSAFEASSPAVAAGGLATSPSTVDGSGEGPFLAARRLFVGLPVIMRYSRKWAIFRLLIVTYNYHVGVTNFVVILTHFSPKILSSKPFI